MSLLIIKNEYKKPFILYYLCKINGFVFGGDDKKIISAVWGRYLYLFKKS